MTYNVFGGTLNPAQLNIQLVDMFHDNSFDHYYAGLVHSNKRKATVWYVCLSVCPIVNS